MGQKVHPYGFRLGFNKTWKSRWFADRDYAKLLHEDLKLRDALKERFAHAGVSKIEIERAANKLKIDIHTSRPGIIIGRLGHPLRHLRGARVGTGGGEANEITISEDADRTISVADDDGADPLLLHSFRRLGHGLRREGRDRGRAHQVADRAYRGAVGHEDPLCREKALSRETRSQSTHGVRGPFPGKPLGTPPKAKLSVGTPLAS